MSIPGRVGDARPAPGPVVLRAPTRADQSHRARWMSDPVTMAYNAGFDVAYDGYHQETGCIDFPEAEWDAWLHRCAADADAGVAFHAVVDVSGTVVGEAAFRVAAAMAHLHVVIEARHAGRGYGTAALQLLLDEAFARPEVLACVDEFPQSRAAAEGLFRRRGFDRQGGRVVLTRATFETRRTRS